MWGSSYWVHQFLQISGSGVHRTPSLAKVIESTSLKANRVASYLIAIMRSSGAFVYSVYTHLCNTLILRIIEYSSFIWGYNTYAMITQIQNNSMRSFLGLSRNAPILSLLGDMRWLPLSTITKIYCIKFWLRLNKMTHNRLNDQIYRHACNLAEKGYKNWAYSIDELLKMRLTTLTSGLLLIAAIVYSTTKRHWLGYMRNSGMRTVIIKRCNLILGVGLSCINKSSLIWA